MTRVAVIPARGGSKRIPRKNIRDFCGTPIIGWSIGAALDSELFDEILVSTDDPEIADIARRYGAEAPFVRPAGISGDYTGTSEVIAHAIEWLIEAARPPEVVCCLYATAPFITPADLRSGLDALVQRQAEFAFAVTSYAYPVQRALRIRPDGRVEMVQPENFHRRSQDFEDTYHDAGQFYWGRAQAWLSKKPVFDLDAVPVMMPRHRVQDIDTLEDWARAEWLFKAQRAIDGCG